MTRCAGGRVLAAAAAVMAAIAALLAAPVTAHSAAACRGVEVAGSWATIQTPSVVTAFAVGGGGIFVTDGETVYRSKDAGCSWRSLLTLPGTPSTQFPFVTERITAIAAPSERDVYLALTGPHVVVSRDSGRTWTTSDSGLAGRADRSELAVAPSDPRTVYLLTRAMVSDDAIGAPLQTSTGTTATVSTLFRSTDGARTWTYAGGVPPSSLRGPNGRGISNGTVPGSIWEVAVASHDPSRLWVAGTEGIFTSPDGGETWQREVTKSDLVKGLDVRTIEVPGEGSTPSALAIDPAAGAVFSTTSANGGALWTRRTFPGFRTSASVYAAAEPVSLAHSVDGTILGSSPKGVYRLDAAGWSDVSPVGLGAGAGALTDLTADPAAPRRFYARLGFQGTMLFRYEPPSGSTADTPAGGGTDARGPDGALTQLSQDFGSVARPLPARLGPSDTTIRLRPGDSTTRTYYLSLPPHPTPVDLFFLLDTTSSMSDVVRSLARSVASIVADLRAARIDVRAGLGQFRTYPYPGEEGYSFPYRRDLPVARPGPRLARALSGIEGAGQSGANLTALLQSVTEAGLDLVPQGPSEGDVPAGSDAGFREDALRVIVHAADTEFGTVERGDPDGNKYPPGTWPGPGFDEVIAALNEAGVRQVGGAVGYQAGLRPETEPNVLDDLERIARGTGTLARAGGVDCNGDGRPDVSGGAPLVCPIAGDRGELLRPAIVSLVRGVRDVAHVRLVESSRSGAVSSIAPAEYEVEMKSFHRLRFRVTFTCGPSDAGRRSDVDLDALLRADVVARATVRVACSRRDTAPVIPPATASTDHRIAVPLPPPQVPPPPPPPANAAPAQAPAPQPQTQPNPNPNPQAQPHPVAVAQRQAQPQMAFVHAVQQVREQVGMEYAMTELQPRRDRTAGIKLVTAASGLSLLLLYAYGVATVRALRPVRSRRP